MCFLFITLHCPLLLHSLRHEKTSSSVMASEDSTQQPFRDLDLEEKSIQIHNQSIVFSFIIFSFLVFFVLCFIYTLYICTYRWHHVIVDPRQPMGQPAAAQPAVLQVSPSGLGFGPVFGPDPGNGLEASAINSLPIVSFGSASVGGCKEVDCSICLSGFQDGEKVKVLPQCCHAFHSECLDRWLAAQSNCPLCRTRVNPASFATR